MRRALAALLIVLIVLAAPLGCTQPPDTMTMMGHPTTAAGAASSSVPSGAADAGAAAVQASVDAAAPPTVGDGGPPAASPGAVGAFEASFYKFAVTNCVTCHGVLQSPAFAVPDVSTAYQNAKPFANFANPSASLLVTYAGNSHCGLSYCSDNSPAALAALQVWAAAEMVAAPAPTRPPVSDLATLQLIQADIEGQPASEQKFFRYFTLEAWGNTGGQPTLVPTIVAQAAIIKMINFLSTGPAIVQPASLDSGYIYRFDMRALRWTAGAWTNLKAIDPYFVPSAFPATIAAAAEQSARADWFVTNIPNSQVNSYFAFLGINSDDPTIDAMNNVDRWADMATGAPATVRIGLPVSNTETHNRIISWHQTTSLGSGALGSGYLFKSYNMASDTGVEDIFGHPYEPVCNNPKYPVTAADPIPTPGPLDFTFFDSDNIFRLPNGLNGYYTTESQEGTFEGEVMNATNSAGVPFPGPTFCFQCHDSKTNMIPGTDHMHASLAAAPAGAIPPATLTLLEGMYDQTAVDAKMTAAGTSFGAAMATLDLPVTETPGMDTESTNIVTGYYSIVLNVATAAAEMGVTAAQLVASISGSDSLALELGSLITVDASGNPNGVVRRDL